MKKSYENDDFNSLEERLKMANYNLGENSSKTNDGDGKKGGILSIAIRIGIELISAIAVGTAIGLTIDYWLTTSPWFMIMFLVLGFGAGILNIYQAALRLNVSQNDKKLNK